MKTNKIIFLIITFLLIGREGFSQNWQLVWSDEFTNSISSDWVFETGGGGWGNNELEYYLPQNASVQNGQLVITAKEQSYGGENYTSVRMKTQGKQSWKYGKIEASIAMPSFQGVWPAFWMLGDNISSVGWPACGEIDIMEHVNTGGQINGSCHWSSNGSEADYTAASSTSVTGFHVYSIEWTPTYINWYIDGNQYNQINIANNAGNTGAFQNNFFILLNMAIGGNWPGFSIDNTAFPANMYVDYVRVYQDAGNTTTTTTTTTSSSGTLIQAENYSAMSNVKTEATSDAGGGLDVGYINAGSWMAYDNINFPVSGTYTVQYRIASPNGGTLSMDLNAGSIQLGNVSLPATGGWQNWTTVSKTITVNAGTYNVGIFAQTAGWNINWFQIIPPTPSSVVIQAENYSAMSNVQTEATSDVGGGLDVGYISAGSWMAYDNINFPVSGTYTVQYRIASPNGGTLSMDLNAGSIQLGNVSLPATGGWQNWTTVSKTITVNAGTYNVGIFAQTAGWNINWFSITQGGSGARIGDFINSADQTNTSVPSSTTDLAIYPNPIDGEINILSTNSFAGGQVKVLDAMGREVLSTSLTSDKINVSNLSSGVYTLMISSDGTSAVKRFVKK
jgi:beta-glucanase (GH16 family)